MKSISKPNTITIEQIEDRAKITLREINEVSDGYDYEEYTLIIPFDEMLESMIKSDFESWLIIAKLESSKNISLADKISALEKTVAELQLKLSQYENSN